MSRNIYILGIDGQVRREGGGWGGRGRCKESCLTYELTGELPGLNPNLYGPSI